MTNILSRCNGKFRVVVYKSPMSRENSLKSSDATKIQRNLKALRSCAGLSAEQLAEKSKVGVSTLRLAESNDRRKLSPLQRARIAQCLGVDVESIIEGDEPMEWNQKRPYTTASFDRWKRHGEGLLPSEVEEIFEAVNEALKTKLWSYRSDKSTLGIFLSYLRAALQDAVLEFEEIESGDAE